MTDVLFVKVITDKEIYQAFVNTDKLEVYSTGFPVTVQVKVPVSLTFVQIWKRALLHLLDHTDIFKGYSLALTKYVLSFLSSF